MQIRLQLGTAAYATMALREVTKTETSSHYQTALTMASDDQRFKASASADAGTNAASAIGVGSLVEGADDIVDDG